MTKEGKVAFLALLTLALYTLSLFISYKQVLFPFPLFDPILWVVTLSVLYLQFKNKTLSEFRFGIVFYLLHIHLNLICNPFVLSFFISFDGTEEYINQPLVQLAKLFSYIFLILALISWFIYKLPMKIVWALLLVILAVAVQFYDSQFGHLIICPLVAIPFFKLNPENPWRNVLLVQAFLDLILLFYLLR